MVHIKINIDKQELAGTLDIPMSKIDAECHGRVQDVLNYAAADLEDYVYNMIVNHDYDLALAFSEAIDKVAAEESLKPHE